MADLSDEIGRSLWGGMSELDSDARDKVIRMVSEIIDDAMER